uniref:CIA30 domain-containing protein n=1 Tax=Panagrellus redivivus TaxID=6233 RepID=A0A7E4V786_PANRE
MLVPLISSRSLPASLATTSRLAVCRRAYSQPAEEPKVEVVHDRGRKGKKKNEVALGPKSVLSTFLPEVTKSALGGRSSAPMNWNYPNKKLDDNWKEEAPLDEVVKDIPKLSKHQWKLLKEEVKESFENPLEKPDTLIAWEGSKHNEAMIQYDFKTDESLKLWHKGSDSMWGQGYSKCQLVRSDRGTGLFRGFLNTEPVKDGKTERAGWCSMKTLDVLAFKRKKKLWWFRNYSHLLIKCRGDGRSYKVMLYVPGAVDLTWGDTTLSFLFHGSCILSAAGFKTVNAESAKTKSVPSASSSWTE